MTVFCSACKKEEVINKGEITFWTDFNAGAPIYVTINGSTGSITEYFSSEPRCESNGCYSTGLLDYGSYNFTAVSGSYKWSGTVSLYNSCKKFRLYK